MRAALGAFAVIVAVGACTHARDDASRTAVARARADAELQAAVGRAGVRVCREMEVGIGVRDVVRGTVTRVEGERIAVRIDDPGTLQHTIGDRAVVKGAVVSDALRNWVPCR